MNSLTVINFINFRLNQVSEQGLTYPPAQPKQIFVNKYGNVFRSYGNCGSCPRRNEAQKSEFLQNSVRIDGRCLYLSLRLSS